MSHLSCTKQKGKITSQLPCVTPPIQGLNLWRSGWRYLVRECSQSLSFFEHWCTDLTHGPKSRCPLLPLVGDRKAGVKRVGQPAPLLRGWWEAALQPLGRNKLYFSCDSFAQNWVEFFIWGNNFFKSLIRFCSKGARDLHPLWWAAVLSKEKEGRGVCSCWRSLLEEKGSVKGSVLQTYPQRAGSEQGQEVVCSRCRDIQQLSGSSAGAAACLVMLCSLLMGHSICASVWKRNILSDQSLAAAVGLFISKCDFRVKAFGFSPAQGWFLHLHTCRRSWVQSVVGRNASVGLIARHCCPGLVPCSVHRHPAITRVV